MSHFHSHPTRLNLQKVAHTQRSKQRSRLLGVDGLLLRHLLESLDRGEGLGGEHVLSDGEVAVLALYARHLLALLLALRAKPRPIGNDLGRRRDAVDVVLLVAPVADHEQGGQVLEVARLLRHRGDSRERGSRSGDSWSSRRDNAGSRLGMRDRRDEDSSRTGWGSSRRRPRFYASRPAATPTPSARSCSASPWRARPWGRRGWTWP